MANTNHRGAKFPRAKPGEPISAAKYNDLVDELNRLSAFAVGGGGRRGDFSTSGFDAEKHHWVTKFHLVRLKEGEAIGPTDSQSQDKEAIIQWFDPDDETFKNTDPEQVIKVSGYGGYVYDENDVFMVMSHWGGKYVPVPILQPRPAITVDAGSGYPQQTRYPNSTMPAVYPIRFLHVEFTDSDLVRDDVDADLMDGVDATVYCYNMAHERYINEGSHIWVFKAGGVWITYAGNLHTTCTGKMVSALSAGTDTSPAFGTVFVDRIRTDLGQYASPYVIVPACNISTTRGYEAGERVLLHLDTTGRSGATADDVEYVWIISPLGDAPPDPEDKEECAQLCGVTASMEYFGGLDPMVVEFLLAFRSSAATYEFEGVAGDFTGVRLMRPGLYFFLVHMELNDWTSAGSESVDLTCQDFEFQQADASLTVEGGSEDTPVTCASGAGVSAVRFCNTFITSPATISGFVTVGETPKVVRLQIGDVDINPAHGIKITECTMNVFYKGDRPWESVV
jgi:hypothetical protein